MTRASPHYSVLLETLKTYFPTPVSNPIMDGYFVHTVSGFLDRVDALKSAAPVLGQQREADYAAHSRAAQPRTGGHALSLPVRSLPSRPVHPGMFPFRLYPEGVDAAAAYARELTDPGYRAELERHNAYNRRIFDATHAQALRGEGVLLSWTDAYRTTADGMGRIAALKSFVMSPWTDRQAMDTVVRQVLEARREIETDRARP